MSCDDALSHAVPAPALAPLVTVTRTGSTNSDLVDALTRDPVAATRQWPHLSALRARSQAAGRGRCGRSWQTPDEGALLLSVVLRPLVPASCLPWLPLLAGLAVRDALAQVLAAAGSTWSARTKWPNDVLLVPALGAPAEPVAGWGRARKVCGILTEVASSARCAPEEVPTGREQAAAVVLGIGVNVSQGAQDLPVPWAGSLRLAGARLGPEDLLAPLGSALAARVGQWEADGGRPAAGLLHELREACLTLGREVQVDLPGGEALEGRAVDITPALVVEQPDGGQRSAAAGDVYHTRSVTVSSPAPFD